MVDARTAGTGVVGTAVTGTHKTARTGQPAQGVSHTRTVAAARRGGRAVEPRRGGRAEATYPRLRPQRVGGNALS
ncbi:hypothetical protein ACE1SV_35030 [Streptomyces sp. E-15]